MNLMDLVVKISCDDQASDKIGGIGSKITGALGTAAKVGVASIGALVAATGGITVAATSAYASYEQLVGGVDKLFGEASATVQRYAAEAYKTVGMSANQYMEQATSFSASLISSLGGDVNQAASLTQLAMQSMADNVNVFGSSMEDVQNAFQGFAKQNYTMLDNLKLGYGGTQEEMARLVKDASQMNDAMAALGVTVDGSSMSFDNIIKAIAVVQQNMGIMGTTANEAAGTIEGSVNQMKAAWDNWLAGLGNETADFSVLTDQLVQSVETAAGNIIPRVGVILGTLGTEFVNRAPEIASSIGTMLLTAFTDAFNTVAGTIGENTLLPTIQLPELDVSSITTAIDTAMNAVRSLGDAFSVVVGPAVSLGVTLFNALSSTLSVVGANVSAYLMPAIESLAPVFANLLTALQPLISFLAPAFTTLAAGAVQFISILVTGAGQIIAGITQVVTWITQFATFVMTLPASIGTAVTGIITWFSQLPGQIASFLMMVITSAASWVAQMASNAVQAGSQFLSNVVNFISQLPGQIASFLSGVISNVASFVSNMASNAVSAASQFASNLISGLSSIPSKVVSIGSDIISGMVNGVVGAASRLVSAVGNAVGNAIDKAKSLLGIASPSKVFRKMFGYVMEGAELGIEDTADRPVRAMGDAVRGIEAAAVPALPMAAAASGPVYNIYIDGDMLRVDSRMGTLLDQFVDSVIRYARM